MSSSTTQC